MKNGLTPSTSWMEPITVDNAGHACDSIVVDEAMKRPRQEGVFSASVHNGINPDIKVMVMDGANYANWRSVDPPKDWDCYYSSGVATTGYISASLPSMEGDTYYVTYDNGFNPFRDKDVYRRIDIQHD